MKLKVSRSGHYNKDMPAATQVSVSEYLSTTYRPDCEYVDGEILERNLGEIDHSRLQIQLAFYLRSREAEWGIFALVEQCVQVNPRRFRIPDVCALLAGAERTPIIRHAPFLCVEILSKDDTLNSVVHRLDDFLTMGVPNVWVIDPETRRGYRYTSEGMLEAKDGVMRTSNPNIFVSLTALFD